jgi:hypothetical protein
MPAGEDTPCYLREALDLATDHEKRSAELVLRKHIKYVRRVRTWTIIKRQCHGL